MSVDTDMITSVLDALVPDDNRIVIEDIEGNKWVAKLNFPIRTTTRCIRALDALKTNAGDAASIQDVLMSGLSTEEGERQLEIMFIAMYKREVWSKIKAKYPDAESPLDWFDSEEYLMALAVGVGKQSSKISAAVLGIVSKLETAVSKLETADQSEAQESN